MGRVYPQVHVDPHTSTLEANYVTVLVDRLKDKTVSTVETETFKTETTFSAMSDLATNRASFLRLEYAVELFIEYSTDTRSG